MRYAQVFTSGEGLSLTFGMHQKYEEAYHGLTHLIQKWVIPWTLVTDNAFEETKGKWGEICNEALIEQKCTEPYSPWQNIAETEIKELKKEWGMMRAKFKIPAALWCVGLEHLSKLRMKRSSHMTLNGEGRTTFEVVTGETPDISEFLYHHFYQPSTYFNPVSFPKPKEHIGRCLGPSVNVGHVLCYRILTDKKGTMVDRRSTVSNLDLTIPRNVVERLAEYDDHEKLHYNIGT
jgi:hypothetical protein